MSNPEADDRDRHGLRIVILAVLFAILAQGCFVVSVSLTRDPF